MELYAEIAEWVGWPGLVALLLVVGGVGYWTLTSRTALLKEKNEWLERRLAEPAEPPDALAEALAERLRIATEELERLRADGRAGQAVVLEKEQELASLRAEVAALAGRVAHAQETLSAVSEGELLCPHCGAALATREYHTEYLEDAHDRDAEVDHEIATYDCGYRTADGRVVNDCAGKRLGG